MTLESLRRQVALIPQDPLLFHRTLKENIRFGRLEATDEEIYQVSKWAHCEEFISRMPEGYHAVVGERGTKLSGRTAKNCHCAGHAGQCPYPHP